MSQIDYTQPLAALLRNSTLEVHDEVANMPGVKMLTRGELPKDAYVQYLMMLWHIYRSVTSPSTPWNSQKSYLRFPTPRNKKSTLEQALEQHASHPALEPTHNPTLLARAPALSSDISQLLQVPELSWKSHPIHLELINDMPPPLSTYLNRIRTLASTPPNPTATPTSDSPTKLLAHSYVRYLGDLSGGQSIRYTLAKAYNLDASSGLGLSFYAFKELRSSKLANQGEMKRIKEWFRDGLNAAGNLGIDVKQSALSETKLAFDLNANLLKSILVPSEVPPPSSKDKPIPFSQTTQEQQEPQTKSNSLSHAVILVAVFCLARFIWSARQSSAAELFRFERWILSLLSASTAD
ncbi:hypothetical protein AX17_005280 [Amanita inopinata Kibby_2008]|nr:hypothetical protein AX17_005280 [Amanita inopinata Kibby_2008]